MYEEGVLKWEGIMTALIGIVILAAIILIIYRRRRAKQKQLERDAELLKSDKKMQDSEDITPII